MNNMQMLLEQWAKVEPEECYESVVTGRWYVGGTGFIELDNLNHDAISGQLLIALSRMLELRGWHYEMCWHGTEKLAYVYPTGITQLIRFDTQYMAESLLRAYLQALKLSGVKK